MIKKKKLRGGTAYLLVTVIILNLIYPISELGTGYNIFYALVYCALLGFGAYVAAINARRFLIVTGLAIATSVAIFFWLTTLDNLFYTLVAYGSLIVFQLVLIYVLIEFMFAARHVTRSVIFSAIIVYLLIGDVYTPLYMCINIITNLTSGTDALVVNTTGETLTWLHSAYYSFTTLTTLGYGDITPVTPMAQAAAISEAVIGVLYIAILMARLVGLYAHDVVEREIEEAG